MSHYCEVELEMKGSQEALIEALLQMKMTGTGNRHLTREQIQVHKVRQNLLGYMNDVRVQKAHVIIPKRHVQSGANDIGFEKTEAGNWKIHVSEFDSHAYGKKWQTELLSRWAVENLKEEAKNKGWAYEYNFNETTQKAYVTVTQNRSW